MAPTAFPIKLWNVVNNENGLITWAHDGQSILVNESCFDLTVNKRLPNFLRTPSLFSLRRSLRWYNFVCSENDGLGSSRYWHPYFIRGREDLLPRVTIGKKRALVKSWLANINETGLSNDDDEYSSDMQLSRIAMTSGNSVLPRSFRQKLDFESDCTLDPGLFRNGASLWSNINERHSQRRRLNFESCERMLDPGLFQDGAMLWSKVNERHSIRLPNSSITCQDTEETDLVQGDYLSHEVLHSAKYLPVRMAFNSRLSTGANVMDSFGTDASHRKFHLETACGTEGEGDLGTSTFCIIDHSVCCAGLEDSQCPRSGEYEELMQPCLPTDLVGSELFCGLAYLEEGFALNGIPVALTNDSDTDHWPMGETRSYFAL